MFLVLKLHTTCPDAKLYLRNKSLKNNPCFSSPFRKKLLSFYKQQFYAIVNPTLVKLRLIPVPLY